MASRHADAGTLAGWQVLVTRPAGVADALCESLAAAGAQVHRAPLLAIEPLPESAADRAIALDLDRFDLVIVTSRHAVQHGVGRLADYWPQWPAHLHWLAVGTATASALAAHAIHADAPADARSEGLLALPALDDVAGRRVLLITGEGGRGLLDSTLAARGALVTRLDVYRRAADTRAGAALDEFHGTAGSSRARAVLVTSGDALQNLLRLAPWLREDDTHVVVASDRIGALAREAGLHRVTIAASALDDALLDALTHLADDAGHATP